MDRPISVRVLEAAGLASAAYPSLVAVLISGVIPPLIFDLAVAVVVILLTLAITRRRSGNAWVGAVILGLLWLVYFCYLLFGEGLYRDLDWIVLIGAGLSLTFFMLLFDSKVRAWVD